MEAQLKELLPFLRDKNPQEDFFLGPIKRWITKACENDVIRDLKLLCRDQLAIAHDAFKALVNLSDAPILVSSLSEPSFLNFLISYIINPQSILADLASMLLSNLTASSSACATLLSMKSRSGSCTAPVPFPGGDEREVLALPLLLDAFAQGAQIDEIQDLSKRPRKATLHFLGSVFGNLTSSPAGREFFLTPRPSDPIAANSDLEYPLAKIVSFTEHKNTIRRGGVASTIKNCSFNARAHKAILSPETERVAVSPSKVTAPGIGALPYILLPLAGPEEFDLEDQEKLHPSLQLLPPDKTREPDSALRLTFVETLLLLSHTRWGRDFLRANGVYEIIRAAHEAETVDKISEHLERLVMLIKGDEPAQGPTEEEEFELATSRNRLELEDNPSSQATADEEDGPSIGSLVADDDDDDDRIEEV
ncbi:Protein hgh1 [Paramarasmius palmivorus]|uniref:Protein hgh1 n=1 Tax=Paramarasmius palmivorus TaxID=297713 RepID=A0AAW0E921_9AGAR